MIAEKVIPCKRSSRPFSDGDFKLMFSVTNLRQPSLVEDFYKQSFACPNGADDAVSFRTDIYMLFNQQRLDRMTLSQLSEWLDNQPSNDGLISLRNQLSDAQLHQFVKSRYIQSPCELQAWSSYLESEFGRELTGITTAEPPASDESTVSAESPSSAE